MLIVSYMLSMCMTVNANVTYCVHVCQCTFTALVQPNYKKLGTLCERLVEQNVLILQIYAYSDFFFASNMF